MAVGFSTSTLAPVPLSAREWALLPALWAAGLVLYVLTVISYPPITWNPFSPSLLGRVASFALVGATLPLLIHWRRARAPRRR